MRVGFFYAIINHYTIFPEAPQEVNMGSEFSINHPLLYILAGLCIIVVLAQSVAFLLKAWKHALELGYTKERLKKIAVTAIIFSIAPAIAVGIGIITLSGTLGIPLPWLRLSVVGSIVYELSAATTAASAVGASLGSGLTAQQFTTIAWTMTVGIITGLVLIPLFCKKTTNTLVKAEKKDKVWGGHLVNAIFFGLIATFVGQGLSGVTTSASGRVTALVLLVSALVMVILGICKKKFKWDWLNDYALPICMVVAMASAIPLTSLLVK